MALMLGPSSAIESGNGLLIGRVLSLFFSRTIPSRAAFRARAATRIKSQTREEEKRVKVCVFYIHISYLGGREY